MFNVHTDRRGFFGQVIGLLVASRQAFLAEPAPRIKVLSPDDQIRELFRWLESPHHHELLGFYAMPDGKIRTTPFATMTRTLGPPEEPVRGLVRPPLPRYTLDFERWEATRNLQFDGMGLLSPDHELLWQAPFYGGRQTLNAGDTLIGTATLNFDRG